MEKKYWDKKDVARITGLSISTINRWCMQRINITFIRAGGRILYDPADVETFMEENKVKMQTQKR